MQYRNFAAALGTGAALLLSAEAIAQPVEAEISLSSDRWFYPFNTTPGTRDRAGLFAFQNGPGGPQFQFNNRDGQAILQFEVALPAGSPALSELVVTSARLEFWDKLGAEWDPAAPYDIEVFAAGFGPTYTEAAWTGTEAYIGGGPTTPGLRDPYPRELGTDAHAEDDLGATPWAIGEPVGFDGTPPSDAFKIVCEFDVSNEFVQAELLEDVTNGISSWAVTSTYPAEQPGGTKQTPPPYPELITSEGVSNTALGTSQQAPRLFITLDTTASAQSWNLYR